MLPKGAPLAIAGEEEAWRQSREQVSPKNAPQERMMAFGSLQGTPIPSAGPSQQTLPQTQAFPAKPSLKQLICRSEWSQGPTIRCKFAVQVPLSRKTTTLPHFPLLPQVSSTILFYCSCLQVQVKDPPVLQTYIQTILHLPTPMDFIPGEQKTTFNK